MEQVKEKVQIKESEVIKMIHEGKSREEVGAHYGLDNADTVALFKHEAFKGLRAKKQRGFVVVRDEEATKVIGDSIERVMASNVIGNITTYANVTGEIEEESSTEVVTDELQDEYNSLNVPPTPEEEEEVKEVQAPAKWD